MFPRLTHQPYDEMECCGHDAYGSCFICPLCERQDCLQCNVDCHVQCIQCYEHVCHQCDVDGTCIACIENAEFHVKRVTDTAGDNWGVFDRDGSGYGRFIEKKTAISWRRYLDGEIPRPDGHFIGEECRHFPTCEGHKAYEE